MREYNPEGSKLRRDQLEMLEVLKAFDRICKENGVTWWMDSGTLLGAARHKGFIPWDDDIDVIVSRRDYRKLRKALAADKDSPYFYQCIQSDVDHINPFGKFRKKDGVVHATDPRSGYFKYSGVGLDVFTVERSSRFASHLAKFFYQNMQHPTRYIRCAWFRHLCIRLVEAVNFFLLIPLCRVIGLLNPKREYFYELGSGFYNAKFYPKYIFPLTELDFEGCRFPAPGRYDSYLTALYGDWHKLPTEEQIKPRIHSFEYLQEMFPDECKG